MERARGDHELTRVLASARRGERDGLELLARHLRPRVEAYVARKMSPFARRWMEPGDVTQVVLSEALAHLDQLRPDADEADLVRWIRRRISYRIVDLVRRFGREAGESALPDLPHPAAETEVTGTVTRRDTIHWVRELVARLPERYAEVVRLCAFEGLSCREAGERLGLPATTVRKRYETARRALDRRLLRSDHA